MQKSSKKPFSNLHMKRSQRSNENALFPVTKYHICDHNQIVGWNALQSWNGMMNSVFFWRRCSPLSGPFGPGLLSPQGLRHHALTTINIIAVFYPHIPTMTQYHHAGILSVMIVVAICQWQNPTVELKQRDSRPIEFLLLSGLVVGVGMVGMATRAHTSYLSQTPQTVSV